MRAAAPGKLVLSGAYAVLRGAPALVTAADRYAVADTSLAPQLVTPEVRAARVRPIGFDASALRDGYDKLGIGSSAAILVATMMAHAAEEHPELSDAQLVSSLFPKALEAHRAAQGGGSGLDVAASAFGGTFVYRLTSEGPLIDPLSLPEGLHLEVWSSGVPASTSELVARVASLGERAPELHATLLKDLSALAEATVRAATTGPLAELLLCINSQRDALGRLGDAAEAPIVTAPVRQLAAALSTTKAAVLPSGAGGGDVVLYLGMEPSTEAWRALATELGHRLVPLGIQARGAHRLTD